MTIPEQLNAFVKYARLSDTHPFRSKGKFASRARLRGIGRNVGCIVLLGLLSFGCEVVAAQADSNVAKEPNLADTISFMNRSVEFEGSHVVSDNLCEVVVVRNKIYNFAIPLSTYLKSTDALGIAHYGFKWLYLQEPVITRFNFRTIDQQSIKSKPVPSAVFLKEHDVDEYPAELKQVDLTAVFFDSPNSLKTIETGHFPELQKGESAKVVRPIFDVQTGASFIVFESKDRAERFVTAFVHAVQLCGGRGSDFAPTPSK